MAHCQPASEGVRRGTGRCRVGWIAVLVAGLAGPAMPAAGQHPSGPRTRPFHQRIALADAAAVVRVEGVETGRIRVTRVAPLLGSVPDAFEIKRSPSRPPPLAAGDRAVVLLRGKRPPYVLVDEPAETILLPETASRATWLPALRSALAEPSRGEALAPLYLAWIDLGPETLREAGLVGLSDPAVDTPALRERVARDRVAAALDPRRPASARRISTILAVRTPGGAAALLPHVAGPDAEPGRVAIVLNGGAAHRAAGTAEALDRALAHPDPEVRRAALQVLPTVSRALGASPLERIQEMARDDPDPKVRRRAARLVSRLVPAATPGGD